MRFGMVMAAAFLLLPFSALAAQDPAAGMVPALRSPVAPATGVNSPTAAPLRLRWAGTPGFQAGEVLSSLLVEGVIGSGAIFAEVLLGILACPSLPPSPRALPQCGGTLLAANLVLMALPSFVGSLLVHELATTNGLHPSSARLLVWSLLARAPFVGASTVFLALAVGGTYPVQAATYAVMAVWLDLASLLVGPIAELLAANLVSDAPPGVSVGPLVNPVAAAIERPLAEARLDLPAATGEVRVPVMAFSF